MTLATRCPPGRRRSESSDFPPVPSFSRSPPAAAPVSEARRRRSSGGAVTTRQAVRRLAPVHNPQLPATLQRPGRRSTRRQDFPKNTGGNVSVTTGFIIFARAKFTLTGPMRHQRFLLLVICHSPLFSVSPLQALGPRPLKGTSLTTESRPLDVHSVVV